MKTEPGESRLFFCFFWGGVAPCHIPDSRRSFIERKVNGGGRPGRQHDLLEALQLLGWLASIFWEAQIHLRNLSSRYLPCVRIRRKVEAIMVDVACFECFPCVRPEPVLVKWSLFCQERTPKARCLTCILDRRRDRCGRYLDVGVLEACI
jgi:hypothetical protein